MGLTFLLAMTRAMVFASLVKSPSGGKVETVFTLAHPSFRFSLGPGHLLFSLNRTFTCCSRSNALGQCSRHSGCSASSSEKGGIRCGALWCGRGRRIRPGSRTCRSRRPSRGPVLVEGPGGRRLRDRPGDRGRPYGWPPPGKDRLVLGHESLGRVLEAPADSGLAAGRPGRRDRPPARPGAVPNCAVGEWDMCRNGQYTERGIKEIDGFCSRAVAGRRRATP